MARKNTGMNNDLPFVFHNLQDSQVFALAQAAGRAGFAVQGFVEHIEETPWVANSVYIQRYAEIPNLGTVNKGVYALGIKKAGLQGVFVPLVDDIAELMAEYAPLLRKYGLRFLSVSPEQIEQSNSYYLQAYQGKLHIPPTAFCDGDSLLDTAKSVGFPVIIKSFRHGFISFAHADAMQQWLDSEPDYPFHLVQRVQRYIEGETTNMASVLLLFDTQSRPVRGFTARRLRVSQTAYGPFGETVAAKAEWIAELYDAAVELMSTLGWVGFAEVECKQDASGRWHLLEINPRLSGWACLAEADGAGLLQAYHHLCTQDTPLEPVCLQHSRTSYSRIIASTMHQPDWHNISLQTLKTMFQYPSDTCFGAWDKADKKANRAWLKLMLKRFLTKT